MSMNKVFCMYFQREMEALHEAPVVGPLGHVVWQHISAEAWALWLEAEIKIINEERLDLSDESSQMRLFEQMVSYLNLTEHLRS